MTYMWPAASYVCDRITDLANMLIPADALIYERTRRAYWSVKTGTSATADNRQVANLDGAQAFRLPNYCDDAWCNQFNWEIDTVNGGSDFNSGAPGSPLASLTELCLRLGRRAVFSGSNLTITIKSAVATSDLPPPIDVVFLTDHGLRVLGTVASTPIYSGSFTAAYVAASKATHQRSQITDAAMSNYTTFGYQRVRMTNGTQSGATAMIIKRTANTIAFTTSFLNLNPATALPSIAPTIVSPTNGDTYQMDQLPVVQDLRITVTKPGFTNTGLIVDSLEFSANANVSLECSNGGTGQRGIIMRCIFRASRYTAKNMSFQGCIWANLHFPTASGEYLIYACGFIGFAQLPSAVETGSIDGLSIFQGGNNNAGGITVPGTDAPGLLTIRRPIGTICGSNGGANGGFGVFDSRSQDGIRLVPGVYAGGTGTGGFPFGNGNAVTGIETLAGAVWSYDNGAKPTTTGASDTMIAGVVTAYAALPAFTAGGVASGIVGT
jgi:hypothetical protein